MEAFLQGLARNAGHWGVFRRGLARNAGRCGELLECNGSCVGGFTRLRPNRSHFGLARHPPEDHVPHRETLAEHGATEADEELNAYVPPGAGGVCNAAESAAI